MFAPWRRHRRASCCECSAAGKLEKVILSLFTLIFLALIQGVTEFLPISSSAHLILAPDAGGFEDQGVLIDLMAHMGSLVAVLVYFRKDVGAVLSGQSALMRGRMNEGGKLALLIAAATPPVIIVGGAVYLAGFVEALRSPVIIAWAMVIFSVPLWAADHFGRRSVTTQTLSFKGAALIGLAQVLALIPGASRSGVTMTAGRALGMTRTEASRFSMLISIPVTAAFGLAALIELARGAEAGINLMDGLLVAVFSFFAAWAAIAVLMKFVGRIGFLPFVVYRLALAGVLFVFVV